MDCPLQDDKENEAMQGTSFMAWGSRYASRSLLVVWMIASLALPAVGQQGTPSTPPAAPTPAGPTDEFDRGTPRGAMLGFLKACRDGDYDRAAAYLDLSRVKQRDRAATGPTLARRLKVVLDHTLWVDAEALSDDPSGHLDDGLPPYRERVGTIRTSRAPVDILLQHVPREDGVLIWKISALTVAKIPGLDQEFGYGLLGEWLPAPLFEISFLTVELWQWIGLIVLLMIAVCVAWVLTALVARLVRPLERRWRVLRADKLGQVLVGPVRLGIAITLFYAGSFLLALSLPVRSLFTASAKGLVTAAMTWLALRLIDMLVVWIEDLLMTRGRATAVAVLPLARRTAKVVVIAMASLALLQNLGFNVSGLIAGLGIGGLAVALAAQETVRNFFGGIALITDQPVRVGDFCRFGDKMGTVEDISIWSTRVRTLERTVVSIPNGQFAGMQLENFARRDQIWLHTTVGLQYGTTSDQVRRVLADLRTMLDAHPQVRHESARARFVGFGGPSLHIEISAYIRTAKLDEFLAIREDICLQIMDIIERSGGRIAAP
jgi:MscS family membrane protein